MKKKSSIYTPDLWCSKYENIAIKRTNIGENFYDSSIFINIFVKIRKNLKKTKKKTPHFFQM